MKDPYDIIRRPVITEKASEAKEKLNKIVFSVYSSVTKPEIKQAVETVFKVKVVKVNISNVKSKPRRLGRYSGKKPGYKKAVVTLQEGHNIEVFDQV